MKSELVKKAEALKMAREMGCSGAHKDSDGNWMPCASMEELERLSNIAETGKWRSVVSQGEKILRGRTGKKKRKRRVAGWENLGEKPIQGIVRIEGDASSPGGLVSGNLFSGKSDRGPEYVRENDPDVFIDPDSARARARQLGCIGISRRMSKNGRAVWMPCTNVTDYANRTGSTSLGRRNMDKKRRNELIGAVRTVLRRGTKNGIKRKTSIAQELGNN